MALLEIEPITPSDLRLVSDAEQLRTDIRAVHHYENLPYAGSVRVEVVGPEDYRVDAAIEMEIASMSSLNDPAEEVREEFIPYRNSSIFFLEFPEDSDGKVEDMLAMGRVIPSTEEGGNKTLIDLAHIPDWHSPHVPEAAYVDEDSNERTIHALTDVVRVFKEVTGCESLDNTWDVATMAPKLGLGKLENIYVAQAIIASFTQETIQAWQRGEITHVTSFNEQNAHDFFVALGYPFRKFLDLPPMMYDSFKSGEGMTAQIAWVAVEDLANSIRSRKTQHMGMVASHLAAELDLDSAK